MGSPIGGCVDADTAACYVEGALGPELAASVDLHIDECSACRRQLSELARSLPETGFAPSDRSGDAPGDASVALPVDSRIGRYVVGEPLGAGSMGIVYAAQDPELNREVALKAVRVRPSGLVTTGQSTATLDRDRLLKEARAMARLAHPNIVGVYDLVSKQDQLFVVMQLVRGVTLGQWLSSRPRKAQEILARFLEAGQGLAAAHEVGVVHRDFKPANVLCGHDGGVRVTDFGLAQVTGDDGELAGTPAYMAPEVRSGRSADARSDQFSFCVALHEALHRARPLSAGGAGGAARLPWGDVPRRVRMALLRGLSAAPERRHPSTAALLATLGRSARVRRQGARTALATALVVGFFAFGIGRGTRAGCQPVLVREATESQEPGSTPPGSDASAGPPRTGPGHRCLKRRPARPRWR